MRHGEQAELSEEQHSRGAREAEVAGQLRAELETHRQALGVSQGEVASLAATLQAANAMIEVPPHLGSASLVDLHLRHTMVHAVVALSGVAGV